MSRMLTRSAMSVELNATPRHSVTPLKSPDTALVVSAAAGNPASLPV